MSADYEEFLTPEETEEQDDAAPVAGNIDPTFKDQLSEGARVFLTVLLITLLQTTVTRRSPVPCGNASASCMAAIRRPSCL